MDVTRSVVAKIKGNIKVVSDVIATEVSIEFSLDSKEFTFRMPSEAAEHLGAEVIRMAHRIQAHSKILRRSLDLFGANKGAELTTMLTEGIQEEISDIVNMPVSDLKM